MQGKSLFGEYVPGAQSATHVVLSWDAVCTVVRPAPQGNKPGVSWKPPGQNEPI